MENQRKSKITQKVYGQKSKQVIPMSIVVSMYIVNKEMCLSVKTEAEWYIRITAFKSVMLTVARR